MLDALKQRGRRTPRFARVLAITGVLLGEPGQLIRRDVPLPRTAEAPSTNRSHNLPHSAIVANAPERRLT